MSKKTRLLTLLVLLMTAATGAWATDVITVTWSSGDTYENNNSKDGVTLSGDIVEYNGEEWQLAYDKSKGTFTTELGNFTKIEITGGYVNGFSGEGWSGRTWTGNAAAVPFGGYITDDSGDQPWTITFTIEPASSAPAGYTVSLKDGVKDADKWTVKVGDGEAQALPIGGLKGDGSETVTLQYNGRLKVKGVKATSDAAPAANIVDLSKLTENTELKDGDVLTGTLGANVKISIADGATVTLDGVTINGVNDYNYSWAGLNCLGDATIVLKDGSENTVKGFYEDYPGIFVPEGKTLTIQGGTEGTGKLTASPFDGGTDDSYGAGIGGGYQIACGNIDIQGGVITAKGGYQAAGIGSGSQATCGNISITGGDITATGGEAAPGIGSGYMSICGNITIASTVKKVTATMGAIATRSIGAGSNGSCGTVTIGGTKYWENNAAVNGGDTYLATSPLIYDPTAPAGPITVTWNNNDITGSGNSFTKDGVTITAGDIDFGDKNFEGPGTFSTTLGNFTKIEVTCEGCEATGTGWSGNFSKKTWAGTPASTVNFSGNFMGMGMGITIVCTIVPTN